MVRKIVAAWDACLGPQRRALLADLGALALRLGFGGTMAFAHGWGKLSTFSEKSASFPDPLGVSSPVSLGMTVFAEFFCSLALVAGLCTRLAAIPLMIAMGTAFFVIHGADPFQKKELALLYLLAYTAILLLGPGRFSADHEIAERLRK